MKFADIYGHDDIKERLRRMADSDRIPHALLLEGPAGTAKFALARAFAQYVHCTARTPDGDSCGRCPSCLQHESFNHIDTFYSFPVVKKSGKPTLSDDYAELFREFAAKDPYMDFEQWLEMLDNINAQPQIYVEEGNELLRRLTFKARRSKYKIVLMWLPERMMEATANKLLKLIEEPFGDTLFVMTSDRPRQILPTVYSRVQRIAVHRYTDSELAGALHAAGISPALATELCPAAEGSVTQALRLANMSEMRMKYFELFTELMRKAYGRKVAELRTWSQTVAALGREPAMQFIDYACRLLRESFVMHLQVDKLLTLSTVERAFVNKFYPFINERNVEELVDLFDRARRDIAGNANAKIVFFDLAVHTIILLRR